MVPSGLCSLVARLWMHCFSLATVGSPHCSLKLAVVLWKPERETRRKTVLDQMYSSGCKTKLGKVRKGDTLRSHTHTHFPSYPLSSAVSLVN